MHDTAPLKKDDKIQGLPAIPASARAGVVAIGNFDGVHKGQQKLIATARALADAQARPLVVLTFDPHPRRYFQPDAPPFLLTMPAVKEALLKKCGVDHVVHVPFDAALAGLSAEAFIADVLTGFLDARHVVVGHDFAFGKRRGGSVDTLRQAKAFGVDVQEAVCGKDDSVYASSRIRAHIAAGAFDAAERLLGWPWCMVGPVLHGDKRGRETGFPTANQDMGLYVRPPFGIYAVRVQVAGETIWRHGAASLGLRPMFAVDSPILETHIFDFDRDIYGKKLRVQPVKFLRPEAVFDGLDALTAQIRQDCLNARAVLKLAENEEGLR